MENIDQYVDLLLKEKGLPDLDEAVLKQLKSDLTSRLIQYINRRLIEAVPEDKLAELDKLFDEQSPNQAKIQSFLSANVANVTGVTISAMDDFKQLYLGSKN